MHLGMSPWGQPAFDDYEYEKNINRPKTERQ